MTHRSPQRSYNSQSLELWFSRLNCDWEQLFTEKELVWGRNFYRTGEVRSTELLKGSAIVHFKRGKDPLYVIVDWDKEQPSFRESHPEVAPGRGLIVAGMYELEEFIADELPPVLGDLPDNWRASQPPVEEVPVFRATEKTGREMRLRLLAKTDGLCLEAGWNTQGQGTDWSHFSLRELTRWEREQLIGYTARAHRSGFRPGEREGTYRMQTAEAIDRFFKDEFRQWKRRYTLEEDPELLKWKKGLQLAKPVVNVKAEGTQGRFQFDFRAGGSTVSMELRQKLFRMPGHTHFIPGKGIFKVDPLALGSVHEWKSMLPSEGEGHLPRYLLYTFARDSHVELRLSSELKAWQEQLESASSSAKALELPDYLRPYQKDGISWLYQLDLLSCPCLLADEMGLGKTLQILNFLNAQKALGTAPVLVVCPASVVPVWQTEVKRFFPGTPVRVLSRTDTFDCKEPALWISSYTQLRRHKHLLDSVQFDYAILDEAQSIKNPDAKVTHACLSIKSRHRIALTGTPMENHPLDLWTLFRFLMPGFLGSRRHFQDQLKSNPEFLERLRMQIRPFILRRTKDAVAKDLPPKVEIDWVCPLTPVQRRFYEDLTTGAADQFKGSIAVLLKEKRMHLFSLLTRLRQVCCDPSLLPDQEHGPVSHSGKLQSLTKRLAEAFEGGSKVVVFSQFVQFLRRAKTVVKAEFPDIPQVELTGSTIDRERPVEQFTNIEGAGVFFISLRAGGTGLNLQMADYVFLLDPWWNPAVEAQAIDRVHRIGQSKRVIVYRMITKGTIEERIERLKSQKGQLFTDLLSDLDSPSGMLSQFGDLQDLIALDDDSVVED